MRSVNTMRTTSIATSSSSGSASAIAGITRRGICAFFRRGTARYEEREVHEHMIVDGSIGYLKGHLEHYDRRGLEEYMAKHNKYSTLEAREIVRQMREGAEDSIDAKILR